MREYRILCFFLILSFVFAVSHAQQSTVKKEELSIVTYYPVPYGDYQELRSQRMAIGKNFSQPSAACWVSGKCTTLIEEATNLLVEGNVGIGGVPFAQKFENVQSKLDVAGPGAMNDVYVKDKNIWLSKWMTDIEDKIKAIQEALSNPGCQPGDMPVHDGCGHTKCVTSFEFGCPSNFP